METNITKLQYLALKAELQKTQNWREYLQTFVDTNTIYIAYMIYNYGVGDGPVLDFFDVCFFSFTYYR